MNSTVKTVIAAVFLGGVFALVGAGLWLKHGSDPPLLIQTSLRQPIMSTFQFRMTVVLHPEQADREDEIFSAAEAAARDVETRMNIYDPASELSRFNAAPAGQAVELSAGTVEVLKASRNLCKQTRGAFDVTVLPLIKLWKQCEKQARLPGEAELRKARDSSRWRDIEILEAGAKKTLDTTAIDLGGIAKGYAIDRAVEKLISAGCVGGIVDIGGDVRCFGLKGDAAPWRVAIADPFDPDSSRPLAVLSIRNAAVCTSGNYRRFRVIDGKHYSHIIDPHTARPAGAYPSVTVVAPAAAAADAWATALSVLGPDGLKLLADTGIEAMVVTGRPGEFTWQATEGFKKLMNPLPRQADKN